MPETANKDVAVPDYFPTVGRFSGFSANVLKIAAMVLMFADHFTVVFYGNTMNFTRSAARTAFPLFAFFIAEGAMHTKNIYKYMLRLFVFAILSEHAFDLAIRGKWIDYSWQNVYFTLLLGLISIWIYRLLLKKNLGLLSVFSTAALAATAYLCKTDYDATGVVTVFLFGLISDMPLQKKAVLSVFVCLVLSLKVKGFGITPNPCEAYAVLAVIPITLYNGKRGLTKINKYYFYAFYPVHLLLLGITGRLL